MELEAERKKKEENKKLEEERKNLFKPVVVQQVAQGQDIPQFWSAINTRFGANATVIPAPNRIEFVADQNNLPV